MRVRHIILSLLFVLLLTAVLVGCELLGFVSVEQRVTDFQSSLNAVNRSTINGNFHPTLTTDFAALKDPVTTIDPLIPVSGVSDAAYTLTITDKTDPATGVLVTITGGAAAWGPKYLKLVMQTTGIGDYRIVSLEIRSTTTFSGPPQIQ